MRILISGGSGFLGSRLTEALLKLGHEVYVLSRRSALQPTAQPFHTIHWPIESAIEENLILNCEVVINLAGASIAGPRWTHARKNEILHSRVKMTSELVDIFRKSTRLKLFLSASGIGFYGDRRSEVLTEASPPGEGFLSDVCRAWEAEAKKAEGLNARVVLLRTGAVLDRGGGFLQKIEPFYQQGLGGVIGGGQQFFSWIHITDWINAVIFCLTNDKMTGPVNMVAPEPVMQKSFDQIFGEMLRRKFSLPTPKIALQLLLGEQSGLALQGQNARPQKLLENGFKFHFLYLRAALWDLYDYENQNRQVYDYYSQSQWVAASPENVFRFFSDVNNLVALTPPDMHFTVIKKSTEIMMAGTLIDYQFKLHGLAFKWQTLIEKWQPPNEFTDSQKRGPYQYWYHRHTFTPLANGVLMKDFIHFKLPMGRLGRTFGFLLAKKDLVRIFAFRRKKISEIYEQLKP